MKIIRILIVFMFGIVMISNSEESGWTSNIGLSYVATSGNTRTQTFSSNISAEGVIQSIRCQLKGSTLITENDHIQKANKLHVNMRFEKTITGNMFGFLESVYIKDKFSGYTYRASLGPGLGYDIIQNEQHQLKGLISSLYHFDKYSVGNVGKDQYNAAKSELNYLWIIHENATLESSGYFLLNLEDRKKAFLNMQAALNVAINNRLAIGISYQINYQNRTPSDEIKKTDTSFLTSLIIHLIQPLSDTEL